MLKETASLILLIFLAFEGTSLAQQCQFSCPDLIITNVTWAPNDAAAGQRIHFTAYVKNIGNYSSPNGVVIGVVFNINNSTPYSDKNLTVISPNETIAVTANLEKYWIAPEGGTYALTAIVDDVNRITEFSEVNNAFGMNVTVRPPLPDLVITNITMNPTFPIVDRPLQLVATVANVGSSPTSGNVIVTYLLNNQTVDISGVHTTPIQNGTSVQLDCFSIMRWATASTIYILTAKVSATDLEEIDKHNNEENITISFIEPPILTADNKTKNIRAKLIGSIVGIVGSLLLIITLAVVVLLMRRRKPTNAQILNDLSMTPFPSTYVSMQGSQTIQETSSNTNKVTNLAPPEWEIPYEELAFGDIIGKGSGGVVYAGNWRGGPVAIKLLKGENTVLENKVEITIMRNLRPHTNVVQFLGVSSSPEYGHFVVTQMCSGGSLYSLLHSPLKLSPSVLTKVISGIAAGMYHLHSEGIIHRDLAARNILLDEGMTGKVADFGLSRQDKGTENETNSSVGPLKHMAPEAIMKRQYSTKSDVWAFGVTLYEIYTREDPYSSMSPIQAASLVVQSNHPLRLDAPTNMSKPMAILFKSCFALEPEDRPSFKDIINSIYGIQQLFD